MSYQVGSITLQVPDPVLNLAYPLYVFYPTQAVAEPTNFGPYRLDVAMKAPIIPGNNRLILISHGSGGSPLVYRSLAMHLVQQGFVVACPEHPHNNRNNNDWEGTLHNLEHRPRHLKLALDTAFGYRNLAVNLARCAALNQVVIIGHSMGGYSALALAGGSPHTKNQQPTIAAQFVAVEPDPRVAALALLAPASVWFAAPGNINKVTAATLMVGGAKDTQGPEWQLTALQGLFAPGVLRERHQEPEAGHYSFLSPFPASMVQPGFAPAEDPPGFDRPAFLERLNQRISNFFDEQLRGSKT